MNTNCETSENVAKVITKRTASESEETDQEKARRKDVSELHIEAMVVIDKTMLDYHKEIDVENYVLTVFNMAHHLYHDASLGTNINLAIVRMIRLEEEEHELNLAVNKNAKRTLEFFREWQSEMNPGDDTHPNHHDVAILLTRIDICGDDNNCGLLGASVTAGMCDPKSAAVFCEDNGLRLGFVTAHEIAHTLAIPHDTPKESGCNATLPGGLSTVMNPSVNIRTAEWSPCSSKFLRLFIDQGLGKCLYDPPTDHSFEMPDILPGVMYGGDFQCRELLGPQAALCDTGIECLNLICYVEEKGCVETHTAAAPGTNCGEKKWCFRGKCLEIGERPGVVHGGWGPWSPWSECSRTCGSGVASRERHCDSPPPCNGGEYCIGEHTQHRICNTEPCEVGQPSFRNVQCAEFNDWVYPEDKKTHQWKAYYMADENPCILFCINDEGEIASLRPRVVDGTKCLRGMRDICIDGICKEIPCDLDLESDAVEDWCGICRGDGTACTVIDGEVFVEEGVANNRHAKLVDIPGGSLSIKVEEAEPSEARIQVRSFNGNQTYIQGDTFGLYNVSGSKAWLGNIRTKQEALTIPGPICENISIWIETLDNVTIKYSYGIKETKKRETQFSWDYLDWSKCSAQCGPGTEESVPRCVEKAAGLVDDLYCKNLKKPKEQIRPCELAPCIPRWMIGDWQECRCPQGKRSRMVKCVKPTGEGEGESVVVPDSQCISSKPKQKERCSCKQRQAPPIETLDNEDMESTQKPQDHKVENAETTAAIANCPTTTSKDENEDEPCDDSNKINNKLEIVIDKENPKDIHLTLHTEDEAGSEDNGCEKDENCDKDSILDKCKTSNKAVTLECMQALKYLNKMQKSSRNKIRK